MGKSYKCEKCESEVLIDDGVCPNCGHFEGKDTVIENMTKTKNQNNTEGFKTDKYVLDEICASPEAYNNLSKRINDSIEEEKKE